MSQDVVIVLDCGATNVRAIAVGKQGQIIAKAAVANATQAAAEDSHWHQWSLDEILQRFKVCCEQLAPQLTGLTVRAITVTTFGVDGALVDRQGQLLYPVISWKCPRTVAVMEQVHRYIDPELLQRESGIGHFSFNTLYKLIWLKENKPELFAQAHAWLFISSLINHRLTGRFTTDRTMAGTSQLLDLKQECFSTTILDAIDVPASLFPAMVEAGEVIGPLQGTLAAFLGLPEGIPVIAAGHDTQFALVGSGAAVSQPVLSSGTWEILMVRSQALDTATLPAITGSTCELDAQTGLFNPGLQWLASGVLEWVRQLYWPGASDYQQMIDEATAIPAGCDGVRMNPNLLANAEGIGQGTFSGLSLDTTRGHFYRAALEALAMVLKKQLGQLEQIGQFNTDRLLLVGGGSRNPLWNQIKADVLGLPVLAIDEPETTVLGAAIYAMAGSGVHPHVDAARQAIITNFITFEPAADSARYQAIYKESTL
ncbi:L-fuculokinase [Aeromonas veronii]|uniref:L-fuculokinase n=1 Tax=Aeromonas veronii TaxID=654 RepID=UPI001B53EE63|nr:L-fuculokinase [Aeromonas veronii]MBP8173903.1 L-fuculokinase [Aeromonadaceae bacterium]UYB70519.1 L-fuculokinase [Aeromonas veronii]